MYSSLTLVAERECVWSVYTNSGHLIGGNSIQAFVAIYQACIVIWCTVEPDLMVNWLLQADKLHCTLTLASYHQKICH